MHLAFQLFTNATSWLSSPILVLIAMCFVGSWISGWTRNRRRELDVIDAALKSGKLSPQTEAALMRRLQPGRGYGALFALGWFGLFGGITWLCTDPHGFEQKLAWLTVVMAFACVTFPLALRELEARRS
jgi:hypothetical protein